MHPRGWRVVEYWLAVMVFTGALWLRVYIHALGQWALLYALGVPVFSFQVITLFSVPIRCVCVVQPSSILFGSSPTPALVSATPRRF